VPRKSILNYETAIKANKILLIVHGSRDEVERAADILRVNPDCGVQTHIAG